MTVLEEADKIIHGDRRTDYGGMAQGMTFTAALWEAYLAGHPDSVPLNSVDVVNMMILLKVSRTAFGAKRDNWTDIAGYAGIGAVVQDFDHESGENKP